MTLAKWNNILRGLLRAQSAERLAPLVNVMLIVALSYTLAQLTWSLWPAPATQDQAPRRAIAAAAPAAETRAPGSEIAAWHLFGNAAPTAQEASPAPTPETPLNLTLRGVIASEDAASARAIIAEQGGKENPYAVEAQLPGGAVLKEIHADRIILTRNNRDETLSLPKTAMSGGAPGQPDVAPPPGAMLPGITGAPEDDEIGGPATPEPGVAEQADVGVMLRNYRDALAANPQSLVGLVLTEPAQEGSKFLGYRLQPGSDVTLFQRLGLEPGDLLTAVNGVALDSPEKGQQALSALAQANELQLTVTRNGEPKSLAFPIQ